MVVLETDDIRPFEWLTNASSLKPLFDEHNLTTDESSLPKRALHVGCGSSTVGEYLVEELGYDLVVNIDKDGPTLQQMKSRWQQKYPGDERLKFCRVDLVEDQIPYPSGYFDVAIDKSTLDCTLCSDEATAALLCHVYASLNAENGVYIVISFHHVDLLLPLLRDCPGADWLVSHRVMKRQVEDVLGNSIAGRIECKSALPQPDDHVPESSRHDESAWVTGSFQPTERYRTNVNVIICERTGGELNSNILDRELVRQHIHETNDTWFQSHNPMLTRTRQDELQNAFDNRLLDLKDCYNVLFTDAEREHLTFEHFLQDWDAFRESRKASFESDCRMSFETAVAFLEEMQ